KLRTASRQRQSAAKGVRPSLAGALRTFADTKADGPLRPSSLRPKELIPREMAQGFDHPTCLGVPHSGGEWRNPIIRSNGSTAAEPFAAEGIRNEHCRAILCRSKVWSGALKPASTP